MRPAAPPVLRAVMESGASWDDPSEDMLFELLSDIERGDELFVAVERLTDAAGQTYMQVLRLEDRSYLMEYRDGSADRHFRATTPDKREAHEILHRWAYERPGWRQAIRWERMQAGPVYRAGDIYSFRTAPATDFSPKNTNRYAALKILGFKNQGKYVCYVVLDAVFDRHPRLDEVCKLPALRDNRFSWQNEPASLCVSLEHENNLQELRYIGNIALSAAETELLSACRGYGHWARASFDAEGEWRWRNDRVAYEEENERQRRARDERMAAEHEYRQKRLERLTWDKLLAEQCFSRWDTHPLVEFRDAARERVRAAILDLQALGSRPKKSQVRAVLKACVDWFNAKDEELGGLIGTVEREDICEVLEELAHVARQPSLVDEMDEWRDW